MQLLDDPDLIPDEAQQEIFIPEETYQRPPDFEMEPENMDQDYEPIQPAEIEPIVPYPEAKVISFNPDFDIKTRLLGEGITPVNLNDIYQNGGCPGDENNH